MNLCVPSVWVHHLVRCLLILQSTLLCCGGASSCPKLQFLTDDHGCQPCSLCNRSAPHPLGNECRKTNPEPVADGRVLWCDNSKGPFPECPSFHQSVRQTSCSESCKANFRKFAPGCVCTVGCPGQPSQVVLCSETLQWNSSDIPSRCVSLSTAITPVDEETTAPKLNKSVPEDNVVVPIVLGSLVIVIILVITAAIIGTCLYRRLHAQLCPPPSSGASAAPLLHGKEGSHSTSSDERVQISSSGLEKARNGMKHGGKLTDGAVVIPMHSENEVGEVPSTAVQIPRTETAGTQQRETGRERDDEEHSIRALEALLNSREVLLELSKRFDQKYTIDKITWHDVAVDLLGWDSNDVNHTEYKCLPLTGSPGDGPMYQVLEAARHEGRGLWDLIDCLRGQRKRQCSDRHGKETEEVLVAFWQRWKAQQASAQQPC